MAFTRKGELWRPAAGRPEGEGDWTWSESRAQRRVALRFVSGTPGRELPAKVASLPVELMLDFSSMTEVVPSPAFDDVHDGEGVWRFAGWNPDSLLATTGSLEFTGTWRWEPDTVLRAAPIPERPTHAAPIVGGPSFVATGSMASTTASLAAFAAAVVAAAAVAWAVGTGRPYGRRGEE